MYNIFKYVSSSLTCVPWHSLLASGAQRNTMKHNREEEHLPENPFQISFYQSIFFKVTRSKRMLQWEFSIAVNAIKRFFCKNEVSSSALCLISSKFRILGFIGHLQHYFEMQYTDMKNNLSALQRWVQGAIWNHWDRTRLRGSGSTSTLLLLQLICQPLIHNANPTVSISKGWAVSQGSNHLVHNEELSTRHVPAGILCLCPSFLAPWSQRDEPHCAEQQQIHFESQRLAPLFVSHKPLFV